MANQIEHGPAHLFASTRLDLDSDRTSHGTVDSGRKFGAVIDFDARTILVYSAGCGFQQNSFSVFVVSTHFCLPLKRILP